MVFIMSLFNEIKGKITKSSQDTVKKAKSIAGIVKINNQITEEQRALTTFYSQIGEKYYSIHKDDPDVEFSQYCDRITAGIMRIAELQTEVQRLKNTRLCPKCGNACPLNVQFCSACGAKLPKLDPEQDAVEQNAVPVDCGTSPSETDAGDGVATVVKGDETVANTSVETASVASGETVAATNGETVASESGETVAATSDEVIPTGGGDNIN